MLVLTMLDLDQEPNQRTHHVVRTMREISSELVLVTKVKTSDRSARGVLRDALRISVRERSNEGVRILRLHPPLNYAQAVAAGLVHGELAGGVAWHRKVLAAALSLCGIARDIFLTPAFVLTCMLRTRGRFDVCIAENPWTAAAALCLKAINKVGIVVYDDMDHVAGGQWLRLREWYVGALERYAVRRADLTISAGWLLGQLREQTTGRSVRVIPNGVDPARFAVARAGTRQGAVLVYVGHLAHYCGMDLVIRALPMLRRQVPGARLVIVGGGDAPYVAGLQRLADSLQMNEHVDFRGPVPYEAVPAVLAQADLGLAVFRDTPLGRYAFPLKVVEYMASGLPIICTRGSESEQILLRYPAGRAANFDPESMAAAAAELLTSRGDYLAAQNAALRAAEVFTWDRAMGAMRGAVVDLVQRPVAPAPAG